MEETNKQENMSGSDYHNHNMGGMWGGCNCNHHHHGHFLLRWLLGAVILLVVFGLGVKIGELKGNFGYGHGRTGGNMMYYQQRPGMMQWGTGYALPAQTLTIQQQSPATTTPAKK